MTDTTITPEERASWRERLESPLSCHDAKSAAFTLRLLTALEAAEAQRDKALQMNAERQAAITETALNALLAGITGEEKSVGLNMAGYHCPYCGEISKTVADATVHDATCPKHPAVVRAEQAEAELAHVRLAAGSDRYDEVTCDLIDALQKNEAENARLRAELETARQLAASAHATAQAAWGGEIPSPLPGHKHMTEDDLAAMDAHLDCPLCGGSGHIGDCDATAAGEVARLTAERDWLAGSIAEDGCPYLAFWSDFEGDMRPDWCTCTDTADDGFECTGDPRECWKKEAARRAVAGEGEVRGMSWDAMPYVPVRNEVTARKKKRRKQKEAVRRMHKQEAKRRAVGEG